MPGRVDAEQPGGAVSTFDSSLCAFQRGADVCRHCLSSVAKSAALGAAGDPPGGGAMRSAAAHSSRLSLPSSAARFIAVASSRTLPGQA